MLRRERRRQLENASVTLKRLLSSQEQPRLCYNIRNLSRGGLRFSSKDTFAIDERIEVCVYLNEKAIHQATGRISYCIENNGLDRANDYGISFLDNFMDNHSC